MSSTLHRDEISLLPPAPSSQDSTQTMALINPANDTTAVLAEAVRAQSQAILSLLSRANPPPPPPPPPTPTPKPNRCCSTVISERIGSITVKQWDGLSPASLAQLDYTLMKTIDPPLFLTNSWYDLAMLIRNDLAAIGLLFKTFDECSRFDPSAEGKLVTNVQLPALVRMKAAVSASRPTTDGNRWWADEVMRIVLRLMELRGM